MGIEPTRPAWKAGILPLNYTRKFNLSTDGSISIYQFTPFVKGIGEKILKVFKLCVTIEKMRTKLQQNAALKGNLSFSRTKTN